MNGVGPGYYSIAQHRADVLSTQKRRGAFYEKDTRFKKESLDFSKIGISKDDSELVISRATPFAHQSVRVFPHAKNHIVDLYNRAGKENRALTYPEKCKVNELKEELLLMHHTFLL